MRIADKIYFSPSLLLGDLDLGDKELLLKYFKERIVSYYLRPIELLNSGKHAFASGALECLLIDAFARYSSTEDQVGVRIKAWCIEHLKLDPDTAGEFYDFFRCGLLHESHIKSFGQFSFDDEFTTHVARYSDYIVVNPEHLLNALDKYLTKFIERLQSNDAVYKIFLDRMTVDFEGEIKKAKAS